MSGLRVRHYWNWPFTLAAYNAGEHLVDRGRFLHPTGRSF
jgi:soluble lytic murein transglycosylase-like protein